MALEKRTVTDKVEIVGPYSHIQVREAIQVLEDGQVISQSYHRYVVSPLDDTTDKDPKVQAVAAAVHTQAVKDAYQAHLASQEVA
jgi:DNA-binding GntR family transcriptional regulator